MALPSSLAHMRAEDGSELCVELATPLWGERQAGFEWQVEFEKTLAEIGWRRAENVPACWRFTTADGDATLITIVDDLLFSESSETNFAISERTVELIAKRYGDLRPQREPRSFAGYKLRRDATTINLEHSVAVWGRRARRLR